MLARVIESITPTRYPSAVLLMGTLGSSINVLHLIPEDGTIERYSSSQSSTKFREGGAKEQAREQIGTVTLHIQDGEHILSFVDDVKSQVLKLWNDSPDMRQSQLQATSRDTIHLVQVILKPAALSAIHEREGRDCCVDTIKTYPVFVIHVLRSRPGGILKEPRSIES